jgi:abortive infection bacteriophage resistance protein
MRFEKPPLTIGEQVELLLSRGMTGDTACISNRLVMANYYRLSGYWYPFRTEESTFRPGTCFEQIWKRYTFDRHLRLLVMDALERIEITLRTQFAYHHAHSHGPFAYTDDPKSLPKLNTADWHKFQTRLLEEIERSREPFMTHFRRAYGADHPAPPIWCAIEVISFGSLVTLYRNATRKVKKAVADVFGVPPEVLESWILSLNTVRNLCAHHGRLWNKVLGLKPRIPLQEQYPEWHQPVSIGPERVFGILTICKHCLDRIAPQSQWPNRLTQLMARYPEIPIAEMGFAENWQESMIWKMKEGGLGYGG